MSKSRTVLALLTGVLISGGVYCHLTGMTLVSPTIPAENLKIGGKQQTEDEKDQKIKELESQQKEINTQRLQAVEELEGAILNWNSEKTELTEKINNHKEKIKKLTDKINKQKEEVENQKNNSEKLSAQIEEQQSEIAALNEELNKLLKAFSTTVKNYMLNEKRAQTLFSNIARRKCPDGEQEGCSKIKKIRNELGNIEEPTEDEIQTTIEKFISNEKGN